MKLFKVVNAEVKSGGRVRQTKAILNRKTGCIDPCASAHLLSQTESGKSPLTVTNAAYTICEFLNFVHADPSVGHWKAVTNDVMSIYLEYHKGSTLEGSSLDVITARLRKFYQYAFDYGWLDQPKALDYRVTHSTSREIDKAKSKQRSTNRYELLFKYHTQEAFELIQAYKPNPRGENDFYTYRNAIILDLAYESGLRTAEVVSEFNFTIPRIMKAIKSAETRGKEGFWIKVRGKGERGGKVRTVYIPAPLKGRLLDFIEGPRSREVGSKSDLLICSINGKVLGSKNPSRLYTQCKKNLIRSLPIEEARHWIESYEHRTYHALRHTYATNLAYFIEVNNLSQDLIRERMGHSDYEITKTYLHFNDLLMDNPGLVSDFGISKPNSRRSKFGLRV